MRGRARKSRARATSSSAPAARAPRSSAARAPSPRARPLLDRVRRGHWRFYLFIALLSLAARVGYLAESRHDPTFDRPVVDEQTYDQEAREIAAGHPDESDSFWQPPLYPYWLGLVYAATSDSILDAKILQAILGVVTCLLTALLARRLFGEGVGLVAELIAALYGPLVYYDVQLLPAGLETLLALAAFLLLLRAVRIHTPASWFVFGLAAGLATVGVGNAIVLLPLGAGALLFGAARERRAVALALLLAGAALPVVPVAIRNYAVAHEFVPVSTNAGINLYIGNNERAWHTMGIRPGADWADLDRMPMRNGARSSAQANAFFLRRVERYVATDPAAFLRGLLVKTGLFVNAREIPRNTDLYVHASYAPWLHLLTWRAGSFAFPFGIVAPLVLLGLVTGLGRDRFERWLAAGFVALYGGSVVLFFVAARYRVVLVPFFALFAAAGLAALWERRKSIRGLAGGLGMVLAAALVVNAPVRTPIDGVNFDAELHFLLGMRAAETGDAHEADGEYARALRIEPAYPDVWLALGNLRAAEGESDLAIRAYRTALRIEPGYAEAHNNLASLLTHRDRLGEAITEFRAAIRLRPQYPSAYYNLGLTLLRVGRTAAAADSLRRCLALEPTKVEAGEELAWVLATSSDSAVRNAPEAVRVAQAAYRSAPEPTARLLDVLAAAYAEAGRFDDAAATAALAGTRAAAAGERGLESEILRREALYRTRHAYREE